MTALHKKVINDKVVESSVVDPKSISMVELDSLKIEQVLDRCWLFFAEYGQMSERYKNMHKNGEPDPGQVSLQRDCFKNGSVAHKTIAQWRRNAELSWSAPP